MTNEEAIKRLERFKKQALNEFIGEPEDYPALDMAIEALEGQKTGKWIDWLGTGNEWECSECRCSIESHGGIAYNYCPICGAKMKGADDEID